MSLNFFIRGGFEGEDNINADPSFVDPLTGNYALQPGSPCIDTGTDQDAPDDDINGFPRPSGNGVETACLRKYRLVFP